MNEDIMRSLTKYGLDATEATIYIALLKGGNMGVSELARACGISRTSIYGPLGTLEKQELVHQVLQGNRKTWEASNPKSLVRNSKEKLAGLQSILPDLENLIAVENRKIGKNDLLVYNTKDGLRHANQMIFSLKAGERVYAIQGSNTLGIQQKKFSTKEMREWQLQRADIIGKFCPEMQLSQLLMDPVYHFSLPLPRHSRIASSCGIFCLRSIHTVLVLHQ